MDVAKQTDVSPNPSALSRQGRLLRWGFLGVTAAPLLGVVAAQQGYSVSLWSCPIRHFTGVPCPTCGMTRSFLALARGDWSAAISYHAFGPVLVGLLLLIVIHLGLELICKQRIRTPYTPLLGDRRFYLLATITVLGYHIIRLSLWAHSGELQVAFSQSPLGQFLLGLG